MLALVEVHVKKAFEKACKKLLDNGQITASAYERALNLSNIDEYSSKLCHNVKVPSRRKSTFKYTLIALIAGLLTLIANYLQPEAPIMIIINTVVLVLLSMYVGFYIGANRFSK